MVKKVCIKVAESCANFLKVCKKAPNGGGGGKRCQKGAQKGQKRLKQRQKGLKESKIWSKNRFHRSKKGANGLKGVEKEQDKKKRCNKVLGPHPRLCAVWCVHSHTPTQRTEPI